MSCHKILLPLDGSELAEKALAPAAAIAEAFSAEIILLRVVVPLPIKLDEELYGRIIEGGQTEAKMYLSRIQRHPLLSKLSTTCTTIVGSAAKSIIDYAHENDIDLIVMSSHGRSGASRGVYGSVAEKVLHQATSSLAIIHPQVESETFDLKRIQVPLDGSLGCVPIIL